MNIRTDELKNLRIPLCHCERSQVRFGGAWQSYFLQIDRHVDLILTRYDFGEESTINTK